MYSSPSHSTRYNKYHDILLSFLDLRPSKTPFLMISLFFLKAPQREKPEKLQKQSLGANDYMVRPMTCTSSSKKPLEPYNPNAARNILK